MPEDQMYYAVYDTLWTAFEADQHHLIKIGPLGTNPWHPNEKKIFTQEN